jgi:hypothetical protein
MNPAIIVVDMLKDNFKKEVHRAALDLYRDFPLYPLLRSLEEFLKEWEMGEDLV